MFSGIIGYLGRIQTIAKEKDAMVITVNTGMSNLSIGESVAVNGVCLTVTEIHNAGEATFFISFETLNRTNLGQLKLKDRVNLEQAVTPSTRLSGHIVQGHVDATGRFIDAKEVGEAHEVTFALPAHLRKYLVEKGSIALDGISLTLNSVGDVGQAPAHSDEFLISLMIIPHTWENTTLGQFVAGAMINVEVDIIAKYVENLCITWN